MNSTNFAKKDNNQIISFEQRLSSLQSCFTEPKSLNFKYNSAILEENSLPEGIEFYPFVSWQFVDSTYSNAVKTLVELISKNREFQIMFGIDKLDHLFSGQKTVSCITKIFDPQVEYRVKVLPVQVDGRYSGQSVQEVIDSLDYDEFPLYLFSVLQILLAEPSILSNYTDKGIVCAGDSFVFDDIEYSPVLRIDETGGLVLDSVRVTNRTELYSVATGFMLK